MLTVFVPPAAAAFKVVVSIKPIHSLVAGLMQGIEPPVLLIGKGRNPYEFELTDQQHRQLEQADLLVWVGPELEVTLQQPIAELPGEVEVTELLASPDLKILPSRRDDGRRNPYFWLDNRNALLLLDELTRLLERLDPTRSHVYTRNRAQLLQRLARLDREFEYGYRGLKVGAAVAYYDTQYYFEQAYALKILDRVLESPQDMLDAAALLRVRQHLQDGQATCLLTERGLPTPHLALLSEGMDKEVLELDSLGSQFPAGPDLYFELMRHNNASIRRCLKAKPPESPSESIIGPGLEAMEPGIGGGRFMLMDQYGRLVTPESLLGRYQLLYFGYTHCPDICPNTLQIVSLALDRLGDKAGQIQPYFITVDAARDSAEMLREYLDYFDSRFIGLTGTPAMIERMTDSYKVKYAKVEQVSTDPEFYLVDHSASLYLMAPDGRFLRKFVYGISAEQLAKELAEILP
ncbi:MAG: SCO family protein [Chromatiales bacterium]